MIGLFTTKAGRLVLGVMFMTVVTSLIGSGSLTIPVASKHKDPGSCAVAMGSVVDGQQRLLVSAVGLPPNSKYLEAQTGVQSTWITTDANGAVSDQSLYYQGAGTYNIAFYYYYWSNNKEVQTLLTSCSAKL
jgi:hypothetical protein